MPPNLHAPNLHPPTRSPSVFQILDEQTAPLRRMLLGGIQRSLRPAATD